MNFLARFLAYCIAPFVLAWRFATAPKIAKPKPEPDRVIATDVAPRVARVTVQRKGRLEVWVTVQSPYTIGFEWTSDSYPFLIRDTCAHEPHLDLLRGLEGARRHAEVEALLRSPKAPFTSRPDAN